MRSLVLLHHESNVVQGKKPESKITSLAVRPEETSLTLDRKETVYVASERQLPDGGVEIQVFVGNSRSSKASIVRLQLSPSGSMILKSRASSSPWRPFRLHQNRRSSFLMAGISSTSATLAKAMLSRSYWPVETL